jgi:phospholipid/cholesterol/gamma-HCH transport system permease protein
MSRSTLLDMTLGRLGGSVINWLERVGAFWLFCFQVIIAAPLELFSVRGWSRLLPQCYAIGTRSVPVVCMTGAFVGMVLVVQGFAQFDNSGFAERIGGIVNVSIAAELGPVLAGVMLAGRVGGALTAELGTMNVTEQLLALRSMGADPVRFLVTSRFLACLLLTPILTLYADVMGALGAWGVYAGMYGPNPSPTGTSRVRACTCGMSGPGW